jgi:hypothetical protein
MPGILPFLSYFEAGASVTEVLEVSSSQLYLLIGPEWDVHAGRHRKHQQAAVNGHLMTKLYKAVPGKQLPSRSCNKAGITQATEEVSKENEW